jgi:ribonuclease Z
MPEICLAGTGGMMPLKDRWLTCLYYEHEGDALLIDCGEGTQITLAQQGLKLSRIRALLITHLHADHTSGLPGFLLSLGNTSRTEPLEIYLPEGGTEIIRGLLGICGGLPYDLIFRELSMTAPTVFVPQGFGSRLTVSSLPLKHSVDCLGYSLTLSRLPEFLPKKAGELGVPVTLWKKLHGGESVTLEDGRIISPEDVTEDTRRPIKVTYVTDTLPFAEIAEFAKGSQLFICEGMYGDPDKKQSMDEKGHMLMQDACKLAADAGAERLWLTHYSPAESDPQRFESELRSIFPEVTVSADGERTMLKG